MSSKKLNVTDEEINALFTGEWAKYGPILTIKQLADLFQAPRKTIYFWIAQGRFDGAGCRKGKRHRFLRNRIIDIYFNGRDWKS
jgi:hypothetical protein